MLRVKHVIFTILCLCISSASLPAQTGTRKPSPASAVIAKSGSYQLTEQMLEQVLQFGHILAGADFSASDAAALRADLIAWFQKEPAKQVEAYESVAKTLREAPGLSNRNPSWLDLAVLRYKVWQGFGENQPAFRDFQNAPFGRMVLKYNPVLVNSGRMIVSKTDIDCQFYADTVVAKAAGVQPPTQAQKDQFVRDLPSRFASLPKEQQEHLRRAELRLVNLHLVYEGTIKTRAAVGADIRKNVHSSADVWSVARQVENDAEYGSRYYQLYRAEALTAGFNAARVNGDIVALGTATQSMSQGMKTK